jgi:DNA topoisomerase IA
MVVAHPQPEQYWTIEALLRTEAGDEFTAQVVEVDGER